MSYEDERAAQEAAAAADSDAPVQVGDDPDAYQREALRFAFYPRISNITPELTTVEIPVYPALALLGEIGELAAVVDQGLGRDCFFAECGDILWYVAALAKDFGYQMTDIVGARWPAISGEIDEIDGFIVRLIAVAGTFTERNVKKPWRDGPSRHVADERISSLCEIVDLTGTIASANGWTLAQVAQLNIDKLTSRRARGKLTGSGDNR